MHITSGGLQSRNGEPVDRVSGFETEYSIQCYSGGSPNREVLDDILVSIKLAKESEFLTDGSRRYVDIGDHPELSTAEDIDHPLSALRLLKGHLKMANYYSNLFDQVRGETDEQQIYMFANNSDISGQSWGSHENHLASRDLNPARYIHALGAHYVSRIVWSGAGKVKQDRDGNWRFVISDRAEHFWDFYNVHTARERGLVNMRDETLADEIRYRRIHQIAGESIFSPLGNSLRLATTSIILRACEVGISFEDICPENPVKAMQSISNDPELKQTIRLNNGQDVTGIELQKLIAERATHAALITGNITDQELGFVNKWHELLEDLSDKQTALNKVDWIVKQQLIDRELSSFMGNNSGVRARAVDLNYHRLLPTLGTGMQLVLKGFFADSPPRSVLESELPLPDTRAKIRAMGMRVLKKAGIKHSAQWTSLSASSEGYGAKLVLQDPYENHPARLEEYMERFKLAEQIAA